MFPTKYNGVKEYTIRTPFSSISTSGNDPTVLVVAEKVHLPRINVIVKHVHGFMDLYSEKNNTKTRPRYVKQIDEKTF